MMQDFSPTSGVARGHFGLGIGTGLDGRVHAFWAKRVITTGL